MTKQAKLLLAKWKMNCPVIQHVLETLEKEELETLVKRGWWPQPNNTYRSCAEQVAEQICSIRAKDLPSGGALDCIASFRARLKLTIEAEKLLRKLCHKDLRYVMNEYDGTVPIEDVATDAA